MALLERFGPTLGRLRVARNLSQEKLAHRSGLHATFVGAVERGEKSVTLDNLEKLARGLGMTPWELVRVAASGELLGDVPAPLRFSIVAERTSTGYAAYCPDLPNCRATGSSREEVERAMQEAIAAQVQQLRRSGSPIPDPVSYTTIISVTA